MISVQLLSGDMSMGADGTVTHIDGNRIYGFGHRFLSIGSTELPFARAEVLTLLPNLSTSFKISAAREWMGTITQDRNAAVAGELGRRARLIPISIAVARQGGSPRASSYRMEMVNDRFLSPILLQMAVFSAIDETERTLGAATYRVSGRIEFEGAGPIRLANMYAGDFNVPMQVSLGAAVPLAHAMQSGFDELKVQHVDVSVDVYDEKRLFQIDQVFPSRPVARPGETVEVTVIMTGDNGIERTGKAAYTVPVGAVPGPLYFTVADGFTTNLAEYRQIIGNPARSAAQVVSFLNGLRGSQKAYVRVWRSEPGYQVQGEDFPAPPPSLALILGKAQSGPAASVLPRSSKVAELEIDGGDVAIAGSETIQVEIKE
jgi:hypothetical protein